MKVGGRPSRRTDRVRENPRPATAHHQAIMTPAVGARSHLGLDVQGGKGSTRARGLREAPRARSECPTERVVTVTEGISVPGYRLLSKRGGYLFRGDG